MSILKLKRSAVANKIPLTTDLDLGELAVNTFDGKLFLKRNNGTDSIREIGAVTVEKNGTAVGTRRNINFIEGTNITLTIADDSANDEVDVTITAAGGGGSTNLTYSANSSTITVLSDTGTDAVVLAANSSTAGVITALAQTIGGNKTFASGITLTGTLTANGSVGTAGQVLTSNTTGTYWSTVSGGGGSSTLDGLTDVVIGGTNTLAADQVLYYDGTNWINDDGSLLTVAGLTATSVLTPLSRSTGGEVVPITVGTTAPSSPAVGDLWVDTN